MKSIRFDQGYEEYMIEDDPERVVRIRLGDANLLKRIEAAMKETDGLFEKYKNKSSAEGLAEFDKEFREIINMAFGTDICTPVFGSANVTTLTRSGDFLFTAFFDAFIPQLEADIKEYMASVKGRSNDVRPAVKKYLDSPSVKPVAGLSQPYSTGVPDISGLTPEQKKLLAMQLLS